MTDAKRMEIREKIEAEQARQERRDRSALAVQGAAARDRLTTAAREHPLLLIAGGLAVGAALSTLVPRSPTRKMSKGALGLLAMVAELGIAYSRHAMDAAGDAGQSGREKLGELGDAVADGANRLRDKVKATIEE